MNKKIFTNTKQFKGKVAIAELRRAHFLIALLSVTLAFSIAMISMLAENVPGYLTVIADVMLVTVALISLAIAAKLPTK